ncbi:MAG TPA: amylo-alpha-1,6-glucosidase [Myxococcales bacterium]|nr:amylo-alpha-1,6-glucosidase [Myxococcales bacterium]
MNALFTPELPVLSLDFPRGAQPEDVIPREWLVTNGLGGYASGTLAMCPTRRYHGLFIPALGGRGRTVMLSRLCEEARIDGVRFRIDAEERGDGSLEYSGLGKLHAVRLRGLVPVWEYQLGPARLERRLTLVHGENTVFVTYRHRGGPPLQLRLRPFPTFRAHESAVLAQPPPFPVLRGRGDQLELRADDGCPPVKLRLYSECESPFVMLPERSPPLRMRVEEARGYDSLDHQVSPGYFECRLAEGELLAFAATAGGWENLERDPSEVFHLELEREARLLERAPAVARTGAAARLVLASDQFIIDPVARPADEAWARASGQDARSVIAGYHWFTDWGRDTMISLEGLALCTGRLREAGAILRTFNHSVRDGLLPNLFPEGEGEGLYHTADATLWFFHAIHRFSEVSGELDLVRDLWPSLEGIISHHLKGTRFHIHADPADGLLSQGEEGYQLTWMDAKVDGWVVTPRRGKAVEINALWFNALQLMAEWAEKLGKDGHRYRAAAERAQVSFNRRFWNNDRKYLFDVVDGPDGSDDPALRPNQIFAISLSHPVLHRNRWAPVLDAVRENLVTPVGLRTLDVDHQHYRPTYDGDLRARDAAYHQGTVWAWLLGHFLDAWLKVHPDKEQARRWVDGLERHLQEACVGQISEIFDATAPFRPRGCVAQAWSVAEALRAWLKLNS